MSRFAKLFVLFVSLIGLGTWGGNAYAVTITSTATGGLWSAATTWVGGVVPTTQNVVIATTSPNAVTLGANITFAPTDITVPAITINAGSTLSLGASRLRLTGATSVSGTINLGTNTGNRFAGMVTINTGGVWTNTTTAVNFRGGLTNNGGTFTAGTGIQTFSTAAQAIGGTSPITIPNLAVAAIAVTNNGNLTVSTALTGFGGNLVNSATGTLNLGGTSNITALTATAVGNTVNYTGAAQTAKVTTYSNLTLSGSLAKTFATTPTVNGVLSMEGTATVTVTTGVVTYGANATLQYNTATARTAALEEWITPFAATGGVIIANTGAITMGAAKVFNAGIPLTINAGATLTPAASLLTLGGDFNNLGTFTSGAGGVTIANTAVTQSIDGFTTTGAVSMTKTGGTATLQGNVNGGALTINGAGGTLDLGAGLTHTFTGAWTRTNGTLNGGSSTLNVGGSCSGAGGTFTAGTGTVNWNAAGAQAVCQYAYNNLTLSTSGAKTMTGVTAIAGDLSITGAATMTGNAAFTVGGALNYSSTGATTLAAPIVIGSYNQTAGTFSAGANAITVSGNWSETGTFTPGTGTVTLNGAAAQTISGTSPVNFNNLTVTNGANPNITLVASVTVAGTLTGTVNLTSTCPTDYTLTSTTPAQTLHSCPPTSAVISINRTDPSPTSAATVSWTVTFNKSVTGVDATAFSLVPTGLTGAYISSVAGLGTTWTVTANTGIGSGTLRLDQTGPGSVVPTLSGTFNTGEVYTITATPALAEYRMDEASWNGTANEVTDNSGSGNNAQSFNSANTGATTPAIAGSPGTCRYGVFNNGTTITQAYVQTPLPHLTANFTVTAWIYPTNVTYVGSRIFADDLNGSSGYGFSIDDGAGHVGFYDRGVSPVSFPSNYALANNTWYFVAAVADITNKIRTIYVFNSVGTLLNTTTGAFTGTWTTGAGSVTIGSTQSYYFQGNLDEVRVYQKVLNQSALTAIATQTHTCPINVPDHIRIEHDGSAISCSAEAVVVKACSNADCSILYTGGVSGNLTAGGNSVAFSIASGQSQTTVNIHLPSNSAKTDPQTVRLGTSSVSPVPTDAGSPYCSINAGAANNTTACDVSVYKAGFLFDVPHLTSGTASGTVNISAVRSSDSSTCVPLFQNVTRTVAFWGEYQNPSSGTLSLQVNGSNIETTATPAYTSTYSLAFGATGVATLTSVQYDDVGLMQLNARYVGSTGNTPPDGGMIALGSDTFVVKPAGFVLSGIKCTTIDAAHCGAGALAMPTSGDNPAAADAAGVTFIRAGHPFTVTVTAKNALGNTTPNYGQETTAESVKLTSALVAGLTNNPAVSGTFGAFTNGVATGTAFIWNEVGIIKLTPSVGDGDYLGAGDVSGTQTGNVGRFYPASFTLTAGSLANRTDITGCAVAGCGTFTYMGERMNAMFTLTAKAVDVTTTQNYSYSATAANNFAKLNPMAAVTVGTGGPLGMDAVNSATTRTPFHPCGGAPAHPCFTPAQATADTFTLGVANVTVPLTIYRDNATAAGPYAVLDIGVAPQDSDGVVMFAFDLDTVNVPAVVSNHARVGRTEVRYGRMKLSNAHGSELLKLPIPMEAQYWQGQYWAQNNLDETTAIVQGNIKLNNAAVSISSVIKDAAGKWRIILDKPLMSVSSNVCLDLDTGATGDTSCQAATPLSMPYLQTGAAFDKDPVSRATFGVYKGNNEFIYLREVY